MESSSPTSSKYNFFSRTFRAFKYRDFRLVWIGAYTSTTGSFMQQVAQSWLILSLTNSEFYLGLISFLAQLPLMLFSLVGGVLADRIDRRRLLLFSQVVQMTSAFILTALVWVGWIEVWHFLVLAFVTGMGQAFGGPAYQALVPGLVERRDVPNAIALNSIQFNLARVTGPLLASAVLLASGAVVCFFLNGVSFLAVIVTLLLIQARFVAPKTSESMVSGIKQGIRYVRGKGSLSQLTILGFITGFCGVPVITLLPAFARNVFFLDEVGFAQMSTIMGAGSVTGALIYAGMSNWGQRGRTTLWAQVIYSMLLLTIALSSSLLLSYLMLYLAGLCLITLFASINSLVQLATEDAMRGRVMSIFFLAFRSGMPLGDLLAGFIASRSTPGLAIGLLAVLLGTVSIGFLVSNSGVKKL